MANTEKAMGSIPIVMIGMAALLIGSYKLRTRNLKPEESEVSAGAKEGDER